MWIARDKDGYLTLFITIKPIRVEDKRWSGNEHNSFTAFEDWAALPEEWFPNLKWEDEPIEVDIIQKIPG